MKFYDEETMQEIRKELEGKILQWQGVKPKEMMGCLTYFCGKKFFAFLVTNGIVLTKLSEDHRLTLSKNMGGEPFEMASKTVKTWIKVPLKKPKDVKLVLPFVKKSYDGALKT